MASTFTPNLNLELQGTGDNSGTWGSVLNTAALAVIDQVMGGVQSLSLTNVPVTVTTSQSQNNAFKLTGTLTGNVTVTFPAIGRTIFVANNTTGNFTVTIARSGGGTTAVIGQGRNGFFVLDSTGVISQTTDSVPVGIVATFAMTTPPTGWLECDGSAVSRTTYATLFTAIGTTFGSGDGSTTFNLPDLRGYFARGWDHGRGIDTGRVFGSNQSSQNLAHSHTGTAPPHSHTASAAGSSKYGANGSSYGTSWYGSAGDSSKGSTATLTTAASSTLTLTIDSSGGAEARPINIALMYAIKSS